MNMYKEDIGVVEPRRKGSQAEKRIRQKVTKRADENKALMKAAAIDRFGPASLLKLKSVPMPEPGPDEVLIALHAAGVGVWDTEIRGGWWPEGRPKFPLILGSDGAGIVVGRGARVRRFAKGDKVWASEFINPKGGFYAEYIAVKADRVAPVPRGLDWLQAGALTVTALTALQGVDDYARLRKGETVLIFGASGAVGSLAVQFAKRRKARVIGVVRGYDAVTLVRKLGADEVIDARSARAFEQLKVLAPNGIEAVLAFAGGDLLNQSLGLVQPKGRVVYPNGVEPEPRRQTKMRFITYDAEANACEFAKLERAVREARLKAPIAAVYPLAQAARAHARLEKGHVLGRIVLRIR